MNATQERVPLDEQYSDSHEFSQVGIGVTARNEGIAKGKDYLRKWGALQVEAAFARVTAPERTRLMELMGRDIDASLEDARLMRGKALADRPQTGGAHAEGTHAMSAAA